MTEEQSDLPDSIAANVADWTKVNAEFTDGQADRAWEPQELTWGVFGVRDDAIGSPLGDVNGLDVVERIGRLGDPSTEQPLQPVVIESVTVGSAT